MGAEVVEVGGEVDSRVSPAMIVSVANTNNELGREVEKPDDK